MGEPVGRANEHALWCKAVEGVNSATTARASGTMFGGMDARNARALARNRAAVKPSFPGSIPERAARVAEGLRVPALWRGEWARAYAQAFATIFRS